LIAKIDASLYQLPPPEDDAVGACGQPLEKCVQINIFEQVVISTTGESFFVDMKTMTMHQLSKLAARLIAGLWFTIPRCA
jgi:hypothetical protein